MSREQIIRDYLQKIATLPTDRPVPRRDKEAIVRAVQRIYNGQTTDGKMSASTKYQNGVGFNAYDAGFGTRMYASAKKHGVLTDKMTRVTAKKLIKYAGQLAR